MKKFLVGLFLVVFVAVIAQAAFAAGVATPKEAEAMVKKAVADVKAFIGNLLSEGLLIPL